MANMHHMEKSGTGEATKPGKGPGEHLFRELPLRWWKPLCLSKGEQRFLYKISLFKNYDLILPWEMLYIYSSIPFMIS